MPTLLSRTSLLLALAAAFLFACPMPPVICETGDEEVCDGGTLPSDSCNSQEEALSDPACALTLGQVREGAITTLPDGGVDQDWYSVQLPTNLDARSLLQVWAGYEVPQTAVLLSLNVLRTGAMQTSVFAGVDSRTGTGAPKKVETLQPFNEPGARLVLLLQDKGGVKPNVDNRNSYRVFVNVAQDPDPNEGNPTTPIVLTDVGGIRQTATGPNAPGGYLATNDDVDRFTFEVTGTARQIVYLRITGPNPIPTPPPPYQLAYVLLDPMGRTFAEGNMDNNLLPIDVSTARIAAGPGTYTLEIKGYKSPNMPNAVVGGSLNTRYAIDLRIMPDVDAQEPNDTKATAKVVPIGVGQSTTLVGRISSVPDEEWFVVRLPASSNHAALRYRVTPTMTGGRFPALSTTPGRQLRVLRTVTQGAAPCRQNASVCPKGYDDDPVQQALVDGFCNASTGAVCLYAEHTETQRFDDLKNLDGVIPIPPHPSEQAELFITLSDPGRRAKKWADDREYNLFLSIEDDTDETTRGTNATPAAISGTASTISGRLSYGFGRLVNDYDPNTGQGLRGPSDYQAVPTDVDTFQLSFPSMTTGDQGWSLEWETDTLDGGTRTPGELTLDLNFCAPDAGAGTALGCPGPRLTLAFTGEARAPWYAGQSFSNAVMLFREEQLPGRRRVTLQPVACGCFPASSVAQGRFFIGVGGANRVTSDPINYRLTQSTLPYPLTYTRDGGATAMCPVSDGGCRFVQ